MEESDKNNQPPKPPIRDSSRKREEIKWNLYLKKKFVKLISRKKKNSWNWFHGKNNYLEIPGRKSSRKKEKKLNENSSPLKKSLLQKRIYNLQLFSFG
jgi:hypothetical protein